MRSRAATRAKSNYPVAAQRGLSLFVGRAGCIECHRGPNFTDSDFHDTGVPPPIAPARTDPGRAEGARLLLASRYNLLGRYSDDPKHSLAKSRAYVVLETEREGQFRTPSLRNVAVTAPYMHNGRIETLAAALRQHAAAGQADDLTAAGCR